ncbi:MAG: polyphosphate polymerase domain-containing protein [Clostridia bacterium]|nr:polyphosphate polymerase domain-containing protein [Clostridia bacterium]
MEYRHEIKHFITPADAVAIRQNLTAVASIDPHAKKNGCYRIRSLYFDDRRDTALWEKLDGVNERRKFRIRYYNEDLSYIVLECKMKRDNVGCKLQERLTQEELRRIMDGDTAWMAGSGRPLLVTLYVEMKTRGLRPRCVVEYMRVPFVYGPGNVRVTIDWNIRTGPPDQFMDPRGLTLPVEGDPMLLEVKWDEYLPGVIRRAAALKGRGPTAFSKYAACRVYGWTI